MQLYKLTDRDGYTRRGESNETLWGAGVTHEAHGISRDLYTDGLIHAYESPLVAAFMNPIHANIKTPILWVCETEDVSVRDGQLKCGVHTLTTMSKIELPVITTSQRAEIGIRAALTVSDSPSFHDWAEEWLSGEGRSAKRAESWSESWAADWVEWAMSESKGDLDLIQIIESVINKNKEEKDA